jgi:hypothetical protein
MGNFPITYPQSGRRINPDGTIDIKCRICEKTISREPYRQFSTATCAVCYGELERGKTPEEIIANVKAADQLVVNELYNDIGPANFKVAGIGQRIKDKLKGIQKAAQARRRGPLFSKKDKI